jgi:transposase
MNKKTTKYEVQLKAQEEAYLLHLISQGKPSARKATRARILLKAHQGFKDEQIAQALDVSTATVSRTRQKYVEADLDRAINDKAHAARPKKFDGKQEAIIIATACSKVPDGHDHWTIRMLADKAVELELVESVAPETIRQVLKKTNSNPGARNNGVSRRSAQHS